MTYRDDKEISNLKHLSNPQRLPPRCRDRRISHLLSAVIAGACGALLGCGSSPVPEVAIEGTTFVMAIPAGFDVGYGTRLASNPPSTVDTVGTSITVPSAQELDPAELVEEDLQRGELLLTLHEHSGTSWGPAIANLPVRAITAVTSDPGSEHSRITTAGERRQALIAVDIPLVRDDGSALVSDTEEQGSFWIRVRRFRRDDLTTGADTYEEVAQSYFYSYDPYSSTASKLWYGWAHDFAMSASAFHGIPLNIRDALNADTSEIEAYSPLEAFTPIYSFAPFVGNEPSNSRLSLNADYTRLMRPSPQLRFEIDGDTPSQIIGAATLEFTYPVSRMEIVGVRLETEETDSSWSDWSTSYAGPEPPSCSEPDATLHVEAIRPGTGVIIDFELRDSVVGCAGTRILHEQVSPSSIVAYDEDGVQLSAPTLTALFSPDVDDFDEVTP